MVAPNGPPDQKNDRMLVRMLVSRAVLIGSLYRFACHQPGLDSLFSAGERAQNSDVLFKRLGLRVGPSDHSATFFHYKLDAIAGPQPEALRISCGTVIWPLLLIVLKSCL